VTARMCELMNLGATSGVGARDRERERARLMWRETEVGTGTLKEADWRRPDRQAGGGGHRDEKRGRERVRCNDKERARDREGGRERESERDWERGNEREKQRPSKQFDPELMKQVPRVSEGVRMSLTDGDRRRDRGWDRGNDSDSHRPSKQFNIELNKQVILEPPPTHRALSCHWFAFLNKG
jgi:RNA-binding motif X-linked protein 2